MNAQKSLSGAPLTAAPPEAKSMVDFLLWHAQVSATRIGAKQKSNGFWRDYTWAEIGGRVRKLSEGLVKLGIKPGDRVGIFANTSLEWTLADLATQGALAVPIPIYASNTPEELTYIANDAGVKLIFFDHDKADGKIAGRWQRVVTRSSRWKAMLFWRSA